MTKYLPRLVVATLLGMSLMVIAPAPASAGSSPVAKFTMSGDRQPGPCNVTFDASASYDPDGGPVTFRWELHRSESESSPTLSPDSSKDGQAVVTEVHAPQERSVAIVEVADAEGQISYFNDVVVCHAAPVAAEAWPPSGEITLPLKIGARAEGKGLSGLQVFDETGGYFSRSGAANPPLGAQEFNTSVLEAPRKFTVIWYVGDGTQQIVREYTVKQYLPHSFSLKRKVRRTKLKKTVQAEMRYFVHEAGYTRGLLRVFLQACKGKCGVNSPGWKRRGKESRLKRIATRGGWQIFRRTLSVNQSTLKAGKLKGVQFRVALAGEVEDAAGARVYMRMRGIQAL